MCKSPRSLVLGLMLLISGVWPANLLEAQGRLQLQNSTPVQRRTQAPDRTFNDRTQAPGKTEIDDGSRGQDEVELTSEELAEAARNSTPFDSTLAILNAPWSKSDLPGTASMAPLGFMERMTLGAQQLASDVGYHLSNTGAEATGSSSSPSQAKVINGESRQPVTNTTSAPWKSVCHITTKWKDGRISYGTAQFVAPRVLLSNAHMVVRFVTGSDGRPIKEGPASIKITPGKNGSSEPFYPGYAMTAHFPNAWTGSTAESQVDYDISWIILPDKTLFNRVGFAFGYQTLSDSTLATTKLNMASYPGDKTFGTMWYEFGGGNQQVYPSRYRHVLDTEGGSSGSGMYLYNSSNGSRNIVGVHSWAQGAATYNAAVRMTSTYVSWTNSFRSQYP